MKTNSRIFETALKVIKLRDPIQHQELLKQLEELDKANFISGIEKQIEMQELLKSNDLFISALLNIALSPHWKWDKLGSILAKELDNEQ